MKRIINTQEEFNEKAYKLFSNVHEYNLKNAVVNCDLDFFEESHSSNVVRINFELVEFKGKLKFNQRFRFNSIFIENCTFEEDLDFTNHGFREIEFESCRFKRYVDFSNSVFTDITIFSNNHFTSEFVCVDCSFKKTFCKNNNFYKEASFLASDFKEAADFRLNCFRNVANFSYVTFFKTFIGNNIIGYSSLVDFSRVTFMKDSFLTQSQFYGGISLYASTIKESLDLTDIRIFGQNTDSNTLRFIKAFFLKQNNRVQVLKFHEKLMVAHEKELRENYKKAKQKLIELKLEDENTQKKSLIVEYQEVIKDYKRDSIILNLNRITNNYGLSWVKALKFILYSSIFLYTAYILVFIYNKSYPYKLGWDDFNEFFDAINYTLKNYLQFLWPTHKFDFMAGTHSNFFSYLIDIFSRIVIGFGIYQMIQAFRKFGKV